MPARLVSQPGVGRHIGGGDDVSRPCDPYRPGGEIHYGSEHVPVAQHHLTGFGEAGFREHRPRTFARQDGPGTERREPRVDESDARAERPGAARFAVAGLTSGSVKG